MVRSHNFQHFRYRAHGMQKNKMPSKFNSNALSIPIGCLCVVRVLEGSLLNNDLVLTR